MSRGPILTEAEIMRAGQLYRAGLTWRAVGERLGRDHTGLRRRVNKIAACRPRASFKSVVLDGVLEELSARHKELAAE